MAFLLLIRQSGTFTMDGSAMSVSAVALDKAFVLSGRLGNKPRALDAETERDGSELRRGTSRACGRRAPPLASLRQTANQQFAIDVIGSRRRPGSAEGLGISDPRER